LRRLRCLKAMDDAARFLLEVRGVLRMPDHFGFGPTFQRLLAEK